MDTDVAPPPPPVDDRTSPQPTRFFRRSSRDRYLGGVAGGIAERFAIDPAFIRFGLVAATIYLAFADGGGAHVLVLLPYVMLWALVRTSTGPALLGQIGDSAARRELALAGVTLIAGLVLLDEPESILVLFLGGLAVVLLRDRPSPPDGEHSAADEHGPDAAHPPASTRPAPPPMSRQAPRAFLGRTLGQRPVRARRPRREPPLWPLTLGLLTVIGAVGIALDQATDGIDPRIVIDLALVAVGGVLVLSVWRGRAAITIVALAGLIPLWLATSVPDVGRFPGQGIEQFRPTTVATGEDLVYELGYGNLDVNLRDFSAEPGSTTTVAVRITAGRAVVTVPSDARIEVAGTIGLGSLQVVAPGRFLFRDSDPALNRHFDRRYPALGVECDEIVTAEDELTYLARESGVPVGDDVRGDRLADAIAAAGFPRPTFKSTDQFGGSGGGATDPASEFDEPGVSEPNRGPSTTNGSGQSLWTVSLSQFAYGLCSPVAPPADPTSFLIKPTIGFGTLEIHRV
jgi:phage shock protein PspC (stress-responsive transcriptional regulator)